MPNLNSDLQNIISIASNNTQRVIKTPKGNDTIMTQFDAFSYDKYYQAVLDKSRGNNTIYPAFIDKNLTNRNKLLVGTYAVRDTDIGEYVSQPNQYPNGTFLSPLYNDCRDKKGGDWHPLSVYDYCVLMYAHYKLTDSGFRLPSYYTFDTSKTVLNTKTAQTDVELNVGYNYNNVNFRAYAGLTVTSIRTVNCVLQIKKDGRDKNVVKWNDDTDWLWLDGETGIWCNVIDGIDTSKALHLSDLDLGVNYRMAWDFVNWGKLQTSDNCIEQLKLLQIYPNKLNPNLRGMKLPRVTSGIFYAIFTHDFIIWDKSYNWGGDAGTVGLLCTLE